jgi:hypothetical protein
VYAIGGTPPYTYSWSPADSLSNPNIQFPVANPSETTVYTASVNDNGFQSTSYQVTVNVNTVPTPVAAQEGDSLISSADQGNQWYNSQGLIEGATQQVYYPEVEDDFYVIVTNEFGCVSEPSNTVHFLFTGIVEVENPYFRIYPVPAGDMLSIEIVNGNEGTYRVDLMNVTGYILSSYITDLKAQSTFRIAIGELPGGLYFISMTNMESGRSAVFKCIK